ncbi:hypothetical protein, partial [Spelaeicoccus albus]
GPGGENWVHRWNSQVRAHWRGSVKLGYSAMVSYMALKEPKQARALFGAQEISQSNPMMKAVGKELIHYGEWKTDPARAFGNTVFDVGTVLITIPFGGEGAAAKGVDEIDVAPVSEKLSATEVRLGDDFKAMNQSVDPLDDLGTTVDDIPTGHVPGDDGAPHGDGVPDCAGVPHGDGLPDGDTSYGHEHSDGSESPRATVSARDVDGHPVEVTMPNEQVHEVTSSPQHLGDMPSSHEALEAAMEKRHIGEHELISLIKKKPWELLRIKPGRTHRIRPADLFQMRPILGILMM